MPRIALDMDPTTFDALIGIADDDRDIETLIHDAIRRDLFRLSGAKKAVRADERFDAPFPNHSHPYKFPRYR